ncbi:Cell division protein FtsZ 1 [uncultured archaeon]|nr:Cell division protein FtsZ 1 [uncultured archaeon]
MLEGFVASAKENNSAPVQHSDPVGIDGLMSNDKIRIAVVGVGGGGCNTVDRMMKSGIQSAQTMAVNTDSLHLRSIQSHKKVLIGGNVTKGLGAGGFPEVAEKCAQASKQQIRDALGETELVFLCAGMGGGTGTGAAPVVAEVAKEMGAVVVSIVTIPFALERARMKKAVWGLQRLAPHSDTMAVIDNNRLVSYVPNLPISDAFNLADAITGKAVRGIADTIMMPSLMNIDYADVRSVMQDGGVALISMGEAHGNDRVQNVIKNTLDHPLLDVSYEGAKGALLHIAGGSSLSLGDSIAVAEGISKDFASDANVKMGARLDPGMGDLVTVTAIVTGLKSGQLEGIIGQMGGAQSHPEPAKPSFSMESVVEL